MEPIKLYGCRHDVLGHYLKAIGLLRVLAHCADEEHRDANAEGWWDLECGCFCLRSPKYPTKEKVTEFFCRYYTPSSVIAAWNKETGIDSSVAEKFGISTALKIAETYSARVVSSEEKKRPANLGKLTAREAFSAYRDDRDNNWAREVDSIASPFFSSSGDNPLFLSKGIAGRAHLWRTFWDYASGIDKLRKQRSQAAFSDLVDTSLFDGDAAGKKSGKGKGTPFFPDAIKAYNTGSGWVTENYPFNGLDYVLAVEGGFAMRGTVGRTLAANSKRFAAFPFVFDSGDEMVDDGNEVKGTARSLWFPLWNRPTTYAELASFIGDAQARLPDKEARFSAEFMRALHAQGVDAGFAGWQEFRFKMKVSRVPWVTTGRYVEAIFRQDVTRLNKALAPLDESCFLDQFEIAWKGSKADSRSPHPVRTEINAAMETSAQEPTPHNCLDLLNAVFRACRQMATSESFRDKLPGKRATFFAPLPMAEWDGLLEGLDQAEFRIAQALASIAGLLKQMEGGYSETQPMLGSLLPLKLGRSEWYWPGKGDRSNQSVWSGSDLCSDLSEVLRRRYVDSLGDDQPALRAARGAPLRDILAFLRGDLDDHLIACWVEALSLIGWKIGRDEMPPDDDEHEIESIPPAYAALRSLLELECEWQGSDPSKWKKRRSHQPIAQLCQRSATSLPLAVNDSLRWIGIWGVANPWGTKARAEKPRLSGRDIVRLENVGLTFAHNQQQLVTRLPAAVCIPLEWRDRWKLFRAVSLPQTP